MNNRNTSPNKYNEQLSGIKGSAELRTHCIRLYPCIRYSWWFLFEDDVFRKNA